MAALANIAASPLAGQVVLIDMIGGEESRHPIVPLPWCAVCGGAVGMPPRPGPLLPAGITTAELRRRLAGWVDSRTGIVGHLIASGADGEKGCLPYCAVAVVNPFREGARISTPLFGYGKGLTETESLIGAFGEAMEQYSAARIPAADLCFAPLDRLPGPAIPLSELSLYTESQYGRPGFPFRPYDPSRPISWTRGSWLDTGEPVWLPAAAVYMNAPPADSSPLCQVTSNGLAAGESVGQAALHAVLELIERDALILTWLGERPASRVILDEQLDEGLDEILTSIARRGARVELYLLSAGIDVPVALCLARGDGLSWPGATLGSGAHLNPRIAIRKAILELGQTGPYHARLWAERTAAIPADASDVRSFAQHALFYLPPEHSRAFDFLCANGETVLYSTLEDSGDPGLKVCIDRLAAAGLRAAIADVTSPDVALLPLRVVRAVVPGLEPLHCGFGMERLDNQRVRALGRINRQIHPFC
jgi:ribosomal protein S12 methylthiotransferase accessory factor